MTANAEVESDLEVRIDDLDHDGRGVGRVGDKVIFVSGALPGEHVVVRRTKQGRHYDQGEAVRILEPSPDRTEPPCPVFGICGGCSLQHFRPEAQIAAKERLLAENFQRTAGIRPESWTPAIDGPHWGYRTKARLSIRQVPKKGVLVGFRERAGRYVTQMERCPILEPRLDALIEPLKDLVAGMSRPDRVPQAEVVASEGDTVVVLRHLTELTVEDWDRFLAFQERQGVVVEAQPKGPETAAPVDPERPARLFYDLPESGIRLEFTSTDFIQVNPWVNRELVDRAMALLDPAPDEPVLDLFCGIGNFSLPLAKHGARVTGLEGDGPLVERAEANARRNGIGERGAFHKVDLEEVPLGELSRARGASKVLLDPPRSGAVEPVKALASGIRPERIIYVSCNPATLARDAGILVNAGYRLDTAGIANMFPHTSHVESIARFERDS